MNLYKDDLDSGLNSYKLLAIKQADIQFSKIITETFSAVVNICKRHHNNVYNGLFLSLCKELYMIGSLRGYDMAKFEKQISDIENIGVHTLYDFHKRVKGKIKNIESTDSLIKNAIDEIRTREITRCQDF